MENDQAMRISRAFCAWWRVCIFVNMHRVRLDLWGFRAGRAMALRAIGRSRVYAGHDAEATMPVALESCCQPDSTFRSRDPLQDTRM